MAELPAYKELGIGVQPYGRGFDYTNLQDELRRGKGLDAALDKLSQWALKKWEAKAVDEGAKWAAANPVTQEQIDAAHNEKDENKRNAALASLIQGDAGTVTGAAIADVQLSQLRSRLEIAGRKELVLLQAQGELGGNPSDLESSLNALINGYGKTLSTAGGAQGAKEAASLRASLAAASQPVFAAAVKRHVDKLQLSSNAELERGIAQVPQSMRSLFAAVRDAKDSAAFDVALNNLGAQRSTFKGALVRLAIENNNAGALAKIDKAFLDANTEAFVIYLSDGDMATANKALMTGGFDNPGMVSIWAGMSTTDRDHISDAVKKSFVNTHDAAVKDGVLRKVEGENEIRPLITEYFANPSGKLWESILTLNSAYGWIYSPESLRKIQKDAETDAATTNYNGKILLTSEIVAGKITDGPALIKRAEQLGVSLKDAYSAFSTVISAGRYNMAAGQKAADAAAGEAGGTPQAVARNKNELQRRIDQAHEKNSLLSPEKQIDYNTLVENVTTAWAKERKIAEITKFRDQLNADFNTSVNQKTLLDEKSIRNLEKSYKITYKHDAATTARFVGALRRLRAMQEAQ